MSDFSTKDSYLVIPTWLITDYPGLSNNARVLYAVLLSKYSTDAAKIDENGIPYLEYPRHKIERDLELAGTTILNTMHLLAYHKLIKESHRLGPRPKRIYLLDRKGCYYGATQ